MRFRMRYTLRPTRLAEGETFEITAPGPPSIYLSIQVLTKAERESSRFEEDCLATITTEEEVSDRVAGQFEESLQREQRREDVLPAVKQISDRVSDRMYSFLWRTISVSRWRLGSTDQELPIRFFKGFEWSVDGETWKHVPGCLRVEIMAYPPVDIEIAAQLASVKSLVIAGTGEPLGHELLQEAWQQLSSHSRSALVTTVAAAEVGFKSFVGTLVPHAEWLVQNAPTPPLTTMLSEYLPSLPAKLTLGVAPFVPKSIVDTLKKAVLLRNKITHVGQEVEREIVKEALFTVRDLLYLLDFYAGQAWALERISVTTEKELRAAVDTVKAKNAKK
jgi:hypothetical protein